MSPDITTGLVTKARRKSMLVPTPSIRVSASARSTSASAVSRSAACTMTLASIGSNRVPTTDPVANAVSVRAVPEKRANATVPPVGRNSRAGSSAYTRASTA
ncbi:Uncharacterised protein [Mycobacteroides abscessus subsp. massiliense]|nr:Uncharacterised protein [Mycobacteroides abscessus subsp. massiliense]